MPLQPFSRAHPSQYWLRCARDSLQKEVVIVCMYLYACICVYVLCVCIVCMYCMYVFVCMYSYVCVCVCVLCGVWLSVCICVHLCVSVCVYMCLPGPPVITYVKNNVRAVAILTQEAVHCGDPCILSWSANLALHGS